jgi:hypothetical protein
MPWLTDRRLLTAALVAWIAVAAIGLALGPALGHDEAAFALVARGAEPPGAWLYRSMGTVAIARIGLALGDAEWQLRLVCAVLSIATVIAAFAVGRATFSSRTGAWAAAVVAGAHPMALRSAQLLSDLPAAACLLGGIAVLVGELERRAGSAPVIGLALVAAAVLWWRAVAARPLRSLAVVAALAVLIVPHFVRSVDATGAALGILEISAAMPRRAYFGEGLVTYLTSNPLTYYGILVAPLMIAGVLGLVRTRRRAPWYLAIIAFGQLVALGVQSHGQPRYVFVAVILLVVLGVDVVARIDRPRLALALVFASWLEVAIAQVVTSREANQARSSILQAVRVIQADAGERPCAILALLAPQLTWYSDCQVYLTGYATPLPADRRRYAVSFTRWPIDLGPALAAQHLRATPIATGDPDAWVWRLE